MNKPKASDINAPSQSAENKELTEAVKEVFDRNDPADVAVFLSRSSGNSYRQMAEQIADRKAKSPKSLSTIEKDCRERANFIYRQLQKMLEQKFGIVQEFENFDALISKQQGLEFI